MEELKHVVVVGAGLAGLSAAYELSKQPGFRITVLEQRDRVGGRVHAVPVNGRMVDMGGFIVYPWYQQYHRIVQELEMHDHIEKIPLYDIYYQIDQSGKFYKEDEVPFPKLDTAILTLLATRRLLKAKDVAEPPLHTFNDLTVADYLRSVLKHRNHGGLYETWTDAVTQGFCYPPADQFKMAFLAPFIHWAQFADEPNNLFFIRSGANQLPLAMAEATRRAGHHIQLNTTVTGVTGHTVHTNQGDVDADTIIFAQNVDPAVYASVLPSVAISCPYTRYFNVVIRMTGDPIVADDATWGGAFFLPNDEPIQILSAVHLAALYNQDLSGYINLNIVLRDGVTVQPDGSNLLELLQPELRQLFPDVVAQELTAVVYWSQTMPIADEAFVEAVRLHQSHNGYYFAGDWLGAPSMETAITTGLRAADRIISQSL